MDWENFIIESIQKISGQHTPYQVFSDWVSMTAIALQNNCKFIHDKIWEYREEIYLSTQKRYNKQEMVRMGEMTGALALLLEEKKCDALGAIYMKSGCGNKNTGQFFTPYHLSYLNAGLIYENELKNIDENDIFEVYEPSTGGGGMMIALAQILEEKGINYQKRLHVVAQDLDWNGVFMTYIQLALLGIKAIVVQGDSLAEPYKRGYDERRVFRTPSEMGMLL